MNCHERIGLAIERAAEKLPHGYEIVLAIEADAGSVSLFIPPVSDDEGGRMVDEWGESGLTDNVNKAIDMAIEHYDRVKMDGVFTGCVTKETNALRPPTPVGWSDTDWIKHLEEREAHPLECVHINQGSMDAYADAYEAEYNEWKATNGRQRMEGNIGMSAWKPKIWKSEGLWCCSYYRNSSVGAYHGLTPSQAYAAWKWRDELRQKPPKRYPPLGAPM